MHTIHYIAVEAPSAQEAFDHVESEFCNDEGGSSPADWSDWCVVGGGRWSENPNNQYNNSPEDVISYSDQPEKFMETLSKIKSWRKHEMNEILQRVDFDIIKSDIVDYISNDCILQDERRYDLNSYYIMKCMEMLRDYYNSDSHFYDLVDYNGATLKYLQERLDNPDTAMRQYLVPVDFHF